MRESRRCASGSVPEYAPASASMIFEEMTDLDLAFKQALIAHNLRPIIEDEDMNSADAERRRLGDEPPNPYSF